MDQSILKTVDALSILKTNKPIVLAISGGVDSMVLLDVFLTLNKKVILAHVNHKKRKESDTEEASLKALATKKKIPFEAFTIEGPLEGNFQEASRQKRYAFFKEVAKTYKTDLIVTAHHKDDQIETFFMRLLDNKDLLSLKGMSPVSRVGNFTIVRPFLTLFKSTLETYAKSHHIHYFVDRSNYENTYYRNKVRNVILPHLKKHVSSLENTVDAHIKTIYTIDALVKDQAGSFLTAHQNTHPINEYLLLNELVQKQVLNFLLKQKNHHDYLSQGQFEEIIKALNTSKNFTLPITKTLSLHKEYKSFFIKETTEKQKKSITISSFGRYQFNDTHQFIVTEEKKNHKTSNYYELWYNNEVFPIHIRNRAKGDYIEFNYGRKKLKDYLIDQKIPPHKRDDLIVIAKDHKILYIPSLNVKSINKGGAHKLYIYQTIIPQ